MKCIRCGGKGKEEGCPSCGRKIELIPVKEDFLGLKNKIIKWNPDKLIADNPEISSDKHFNNYVKVLTGICNNASKGLLADKSIMLVSPRCMGKHTFIKCLFSELEQHGMDCHPVIDHNEYLRSVILGSERPLRKYSIDLDRVVYCDAFAISIDYDNRFSALRAIRSVLEKRGNAGKPTFILSDFPLSALSTGNYNDVDIRYRDGRDPLRYCRVISTYN